MKKILSMTLFLLIMMSCASPEEKCEAMIAPIVKQSLYYPDTYSSAGTIIDTLYYPIYSTKESCLAFETIVDLILDKKGFQEQIDELNADIDRYSSYGYTSNYFRAQCRTMQSEIADCQKEIELIQDKIAQNVAVMAAVFEDFDPQRIYNFVVTHRYRAENGMGIVSFGECIAIFDNKLKEITHIMKLPSDEDMIYVNNELGKYVKIMEESLCQ